MPKVESVLCIRSLGELAWLASRIGHRMIDSKTEPSSNSLRDFWQSTRKLQRTWTETLDSLSVSSEPDVARLAELAAQLFTTEMVVRVWATILAGVDQQTGRSDLSRIALNSVSGLMQVRNQVISKLLSLPVHQTSRAAELDRLRRRCDRWTDLLIGNLIGTSDFVEFAFDPERARDFAEESHDFDPCLGPNPVDHLVAAGLRLGFLGQLPNVTLTDPAFAGLVQSIIGSLPEQAFDQDGLLLSGRELRGNTGSPENLPAEPTADDVLLPGISFAKLRKRFR